MFLQKLQSQSPSLTLIPEGSKTGAFVFGDLEGGTCAYPLLRS